MFLALRDLRFANGRFALMGTVIGLLTLLVVMLSGLTAGLAAESVSAVRGLPADHIAFDEPPKGQQVSFTGSRVTAEQVRAWNGRDGVASASPLGIAPTRLDIGEQKVAVTAFGAEPQGPLAPRELTEGGARVVVSDALAAEAALAAGDTVRLDGRTYTVAGTVDSASFSHTPVVWLSLSGWQQLNAARDAYASVLALDTTGKANLAAADTAASTVTRELSGSFAAIGSFSAENKSLTLIRVLLFAVSALVVGAFFTVWTIQRAPDLAVLKAIGATDRYLVRDALTQALAVLVFGGLAGAGLAAGLGMLAARAVPFVVDPGTTLVPLAAMVAVGVMGAALAVRRITSVDPLAALGAAR